MEWISVNERLPKNGEACWYYFDKVSRLESDVGSNPARTTKFLAYFGQN